MEKSSFFNSVSHDRTYKAEDWAEYFASFIGNGVFPVPSTGLQVVANDGMKLNVKTGKAWINGQEATSYTFQYDYYWMMGDNRHNSADSRSWGFVPEDHIVGKPILVWLSLDKDRSLLDGGIRWDRIFRWVDAN